MRAETSSVNMNTLDILNVLQNEKDFGGVRPSDKLKTCEPNKFYILNTDPSTKPGHHWVAVYLKPGLCEFFDSLGEAPSKYNQDFDKLMLLNGPKYMYNTHRIQNYSSQVCGHYCIFYIIMRCKGYSLLDIVQFFSKNRLQFNDAVVANFHRNYWFKI